MTRAAVASRPRAWRSTRPCLAGRAGRARRSGRSPCSTRTREVEVDPRHVTTPTSANLVRRIVPLPGREGADMTQADQVRLRFRGPWQQTTTSSWPGDASRVRRTRGSQHPATSSVTSATGRARGLTGAERSRSRRAGRRRRRSRGRGCRARWSGCPWPRAGGRTRARRRGRRRSTSSPGVGLSGIRLTCTQPQSPYDVEHVGEQVGAPGLVVDAAHHGVLDRDPALGRPRVVPGGLDGLGDRAAGVDRDQLVAQLVVGRVQAQRQGDRDALVGELAHPRAPARRWRR